MYTSFKSTFSDLTLLCVPEFPNKKTAALNWLGDISQQNVILSTHITPPRTSETIFETKWGGLIVLENCIIIYKKEGNIYTYIPCVFQFKEYQTNINDYTVTLSASSYPEIETVLDYENNTIPIETFERRVGREILSKMYTLYTDTLTQEIDYVIEKYEALPAPFSECPQNVVNNQFLVPAYLALPKKNPNIPPFIAQDLTRLAKTYSYLKNGPNDKIIQIQLKSPDIGQHGKLGPLKIGYSEYGFTNITKTSFWTHFAVPYLEKKYANYFYGIVWNSHPKNSQLESDIAAELYKSSHEFIKDVTVYSQEGYTLEYISSLE
jgi:hypothetical protein